MGCPCRLTRSVPMAGGRALQRLNNTNWSRAQHMRHLICHNLITVTSMYVLATIAWHCSVAPNFQRLFATTQGSLADMMLTAAHHNQHRHLPRYWQHNTMQYMPARSDVTVQDKWTLDTQENKQAPNLTLQTSFTEAEHNTALGCLPLSNSFHTKHYFR